MTLPLSALSQSHPPFCRLDLSKSWTHYTQQRERQAVHGNSFTMFYLKKQRLNIKFPSKPFFLFFSCERAEGSSPVGDSVKPPPRAHNAVHLNYLSKKILPLAIAKERSWTVCAKGRQTSSQQTQKKKAVWKRAVNTTVFHCRNILSTAAWTCSGSFSLQTNVLCRE